VPWFLDIERSSGERSSVQVAEPPLIIGRGEDCGVRLSDLQVSRHHSRFSLRGGELWVEDLGSHNGTRVNGQAISAPRRLADLDLVEISSHRMSVRDTAASGRSNTTGSGLNAVFRDASVLIARTPPAVGAPDAEAQLRRYAERLRLVNEVHAALAVSPSRDELLALILDRVFRHLRPEQAAVLLLGADGEAVIAASRPLGMPTNQLFTSRSLVREVVDKRLAALVVDAPTDERFAAAQSMLQAGVRSVLAAPLLTAERTLGLVVLSSRLTAKQFSDEDLELLVSLASAAALHLHNLELARATEEHRRLEQELTLARRIQVALLPERLPEIPGFALLGGNVPSRGVSGDLYTVAVREEDCVLMVADVSGKGMAASLLGASLEALSVGPIEVGHDADEICLRVSRRLFQRTPPEKYATAFVAILNPTTNALRWCNAGHNPALLVRTDGSVEKLAKGGHPLGLLALTTYRAEASQLGPGDLLVIYTDGVTEACDSSDEEYGIERLAEVCRMHRGGGLVQLRQAIEDSLAAFVRGTPFADDRTLLLLKRDGG
jgi:phosphoserine phosphatase RsbU/P